MNANLQQNVVTYVAYLLVGTLSVLGYHFFNIPDASSTLIVVSFVFGHLLGLQVPTPGSVPASTILAVDPIVETQKAVTPSQKGVL